MTTNIDAAFSAIVEPLEAEAKAAIVHAIVDLSAGNAEAKEQAATSIAQYESGFAAECQQVHEAVLAGVSLSDIEAGLKADHEATGTKHFASSKSSLTYVDSLGKFAALGGKRPEGMVFRSPDEVAVPEGCKSLWTVVRSICRTNGKTAIFKAAKVAYGKGAVEAIIEAAEDQEQAWEGLLGLVAAQEKAIKKAATETVEVETDSDETGGATSEETEAKPVNLAAKLATINEVLADLYAAAAQDEADLSGMAEQVKSLSLRAAAFSLLINGAGREDDDEDDE